jgi:hypothetical protein
MCEKNMQHEPRMRVLVDKFRKTDTGEFEFLGRVTAESVVEELTALGKAYMERNKIRLTREERIDIERENEEILQGQFRDVSHCDSEFEWRGDLYYEESN